MFGFYGKKASAASTSTSDKKASAASTSTSDTVKPLTLLVIQSDKYDWKQFFAGRRLADGTEIIIEQVGWHEIHVNAETHARSSVLVHIGGRTIIPDFVLVRNECRTPTHDYRNQLFGLMFGSLGAVNSLSSIYSFCERPIVQAELIKLAKMHGDAFPLIDQSYFSSYAGMMYGNSFPAVVKVGHAHAGYGKMQIRDHHDMEDFRTVLALTEGKYCTAEPFVEGAYDLRVQKIGERVRVFKRQSVSGNWKTNTGTSQCEEIEATPQYVQWAALASEMFGGLDICTVDAISCAETGKESILEVNGTSSGLFPGHEDEDNNDIAELVMIRIEEARAAQSGQGAESNGGTNGGTNGAKACT
jgi:D-alanine-D-alanine ligase-like ATP-grasp enzyme